MARKIDKFQFKRGPKSRLTTLSPAEMAFTEDEKKLYFGDGNENIRLLDQKDKSELTTQLADTSKELIRLRTFAGEKFPVYISHNGLNYIAPINSLPAYELAAEVGYKYFEVDVRTSSDNVWYCFHDDNIDDMTDGTGSFSSKTATQVNALNIDTFSSSYYGTKIPTLEKFLKFCTKWGGVPVIEIKVYNNDANLADLINIIRNNGLLNKCIVMAFGTETLSKLRRLNNEIPLCQLSNTATQEDLERATSVNSDYVSINKSAVTQSFCQLAHQQGIKVGAWTIDSENDVTNFINMGVDVITTNSLIPRGVR